MPKPQLRPYLLLLLAAVIWGLSFVAQRVSLKYLGSFTFNGVRFALGSLSLLPLIIFTSKKPIAKPESVSKPPSTLMAGILVGCVLFIAASLQQIGLIETTAGKAGFITGLYLVFVPLIGIFLSHRTHLQTWMGVALATTGLYFLSVSSDFSIVKGDALELGAAFFCALHILLIGRLSQQVPVLKLCLIQYLTCSILSMAAALVFEKITLYSLWQALVPILYGGIFSAGIANTLQVFGQRHAKPAPAAIILSLEAVFAAIGGWLILGEDLGIRGYLGCGLMLAGMLLSQLPGMGKDQASDSSGSGAL